MILSKSSVVFLNSGMIPKVKVRKSIRKQKCVIICVCLHNFNYEMKMVINGTHQCCPFNVFVLLASFSYIWLLLAKSNHSENS